MSMCKANLHSRPAIQSASMAPLRRHTQAPMELWKPPQLFLPMQAALVLALTPSPSPTLLWTEEAGWRSITPLSTPTLPRFRALRIQRAQAVRVIKAIHLPSLPEYSPDALRLPWHSYLPSFGDADVQPKTMLPSSIGPLPIPEPRGSDPWTQIKIRWPRVFSPGQNSCQENSFLSGESVEISCVRNATSGGWNWCTPIT